MKLSNDKFIHWTTEAYKCPRCNQETYQEEIKDKLNEMRIKSSIFDKEIEDRLTIRCPVCHKSSLFSSWKTVEEYNVPYQPGDTIDAQSEETLIDGPLYHCPSENMNVRPAFAEMCKTCPHKSGSDCNMPDDD